MQKIIGTSTQLLIRCKIQELSCSASLLDSPPTSHRGIVSGISNSSSSPTSRNNANGNAEGQSSVLSKDQVILNILSTLSIACSDSNIDVVAKKIAYDVSKNISRVNDDQASAFICLKPTDDYIVSNENER